VPFAVKELSGKNKQFESNMRIASAWFLLILSASQWIGGHLCLEVSYWMTVQRQMSFEEKALAELVHQKTGIESAVRVLPENELTPRGNFYGDFVFSKETEAETIYYTIEYQVDSVVRKALGRASDQKPPICNGPSDKLLKGLFKVFVMPEYQGLVPLFQQRPASIFHFTSPNSFLFKPLLLHPPAQA